MRKGVLVDERPRTSNPQNYAAEAAEYGFDVITLHVDLSELDRLVLEDEEEGVIKVYAERETVCVLEATPVASHAVDMISELTVAIVAEGSVGCHPSLSHSGRGDPQGHR